MLFAEWHIDQVNRARMTLDDVAGKSINVAKVLKRLGADPCAISLLGGLRGEHIKRALERHGIPLAAADATTETRQCVTVLDEEGGTTTELVEETAPVAPALAEELMAMVRVRLPQARALVMSGTIAPGLGDGFYRACTRLARERGVFTVVDATGEPLRQSLDAQPDLVKPNRTELAFAVGRDLPGEMEVRRAMLELQDLGARSVVITDGPHPVLASEKGRFWKITPPRRAVRNPIGSGDAFTAGLTWRLLDGDDLGEACRWGCACGLVNALSLLAGEVDPAMVEALTREVAVEETPLG